MKKLISLTTIIFLISGYACADNLSTESKKFVESVIKKQFPKAKYDKTEKYWFYLDNEYTVTITPSIKEIATQEGKVRIIALSEDNIAEKKVHLYEFKKSENDWKKTFSNIYEVENTDYPSQSYIGEVVSLGKEKLGVELKTQNEANHGFESSTEWLYLVGNKPKMLKGCINFSSMASTIDLNCQYKIRTDLSENSEFYPVEFSYNLTKYQAKEFGPDEAPKGWEHYNQSYYRKFVGKRTGKVIAHFDSTKQAYVLPNKFTKALNSEMNNQALWNYFKK
ncbi:hypothetical protein HT665_09035 [Ursidibacter maritimus]|uniref:Uncharacterized protein n=1 Tax=Ursidibacter maritimus TaxID=1331689 RepID=A0A949T3P9_9PAST|nr:hypothetical protein [Ursidibacter maritimus]KAE9538769.1 hypothetical protein A1D26_05715 [Ursidibacter maritimus]MBV6523390.1 hypothetical protein [Ursidibacter maritimus]MBV6526465.1 hypothetical protein [Ursidibacter maritimus]MBV6527796.1 hypothetical protein [Ursidibacter maritimus]MBV6529817.1 hypothetical protein [Ursidibacter maritimus]